MSDQNRRKLLRALSAAPVVMSLQPGTAAATSSAYQCLRNLRTQADANPKWIPHQQGVLCGSGDIGCDAHRAYPYWELKSTHTRRWVRNFLSRNLSTNPEKKIVKLDTGYCQMTGSPADLKSGEFLEWDGNDGALIIKRWNSNKNKWQKVQVSNGGRMIAHLPDLAQLDNPHEPTGIVDVKSWPEAPDDWVRISGSCLDSINMQGDPRWKWAKMAQY